MIRMVARTAALGIALAVAVTQLPAGAYGQDQPVYGSQLMTEQERAEYQARMRAATTEQEREQIRLEHHAQMQERAKQQGVTLPDEPPAMGMGGQHMGPGQGGPGGGAGMGGAGRGRGGRGG
jgi:hypothetical protein